MPVYMDRHDDVSETPEETAEAHLKDIEVQGKYGVRYLTYWIDERTARGFCLVDAPSKEAAEAVHREAHDSVANVIIEVDRPVVEDFMGSIAETPAAIDPATTEMQSGLRIILFTDMEDSTSITQRLGDARAMDLLRTHNALIRDALNAHSGREVKHTGDGLMASFVSVSRAVECAIGIQRAFAGYNDENPEEPIRVRIGLNAGEPVVENQDLFGASIQLARRTCDAAGSGCILVSNVVRELCIGKRFEFQDKGEHSLKGFDEPVKLHEVMWSSCA